MIRLGLLLKDLWSRGSGWILSLRGRAPKPHPYGLEVVSDLPERYAPGLLYVVKEGRTEMQVSMVCPLGRCRETLNVNLLPDDHPKWKLSIDSKRKPLLSPSVWRKKDCGCHFWLKGGEITWC